MRDPDWSMYSDTKHITESATARLASNLKRALREAYGIHSTRYNYTSNKRKLDSNPNRRMNDFKTEPNKLVGTYGSWSTW